MNKEEEFNRKEYMKTYNKKYKAKNKDSIDRYNKMHYKGNSEKLKERKIRMRRKNRRNTITEYGGKCVCCGEDGFEFLTFDHINNDGAAHRKEINRDAGEPFVLWLIKNNYPKDIIQLLCMNCNHAKDKYGQCPHGNTSF